MLMIFQMVAYSGEVGHLFRRKPTTGSLFCATVGNASDEAGHSERQTEINCHAHRVVNVAKIINVINSN